MAHCYSFENQLLELFRSNYEIYTGPIGQFNSDEVDIKAEASYNATA